MESVFDRHNAYVQGDNLLNLFCFCALFKVLQNHVMYIFTQHVGKFIASFTLIIMYQKGTYFIINFI